MRLFVALGLTLLATSSSAQETAAPAPQAAAAPAKLAPGMPAPPIAIETWVKGEPVATFEQGRMYVIEFWATWCGPCIASMPHLTRLQSQYEDKLTIVGVTCADPRNTLEAVRGLVAKRGEAMGYRVAWDKGRTTTEAYLRAAGKNGIPCSFLVDGQGRIAYIGHPMLLDEPIAKLIAGTWNAERDAAELERETDTFFGFYGSLRTDPKGTLPRLAAFETKHPDLAVVTDPLRFRLLLATGDGAGASAVGARVVERASVAGDVAQLLDLAGQIIDPAAKVAPPDLDLALRAAQKAVDATSQTDAGALETLARVQAARNEHTAAVATLTQALQVANERQKADLMRLIEEYRAKPAGGG
jgi:thiol-disulfide isomerase/thioredoxin